MDLADLNSPYQELSNVGLGIVVAHLISDVLAHSFFVCVYWRSSPAVSNY